ncbi:MAG: TAXI family TRAP transporter solute-binding subunit [Xanthobacteraceae bacterium]
MRRMLRHTWLVAIGGILALVGLTAAALYFASQPTILKVAVGPPNSEDLRVIQTIAQHFARERTAIRLRPIIKDGAAQSAAALDSGEADLAVVRRDVAMPQAGQAVAILRKNLVMFVAPAPAAAAGKAKRGKKAAAKEEETKKIEKIEDLAGRRLAVVGRSPANISLLKVILTQYGIPPEKVEVVQIDTADVGTKIRESRTDAIMLVGPVGSRITAEAVAAAMRDKEAPTFIPVDAAEAIAQRVAVYESTEIAAGAFGGAPQKPPEAVETIGFSHYIVARRSLDESTAGEFTRLLLGARQSLSAELPAIGKIEPPDTEKGAAVAVHPGAAAFIDGEQKSFFERYNDWIYYGLMLLSFVGSAMAWLMNYSKVDDHAKKLTLLDRLLEVMQEARQASTLDTLEQLQTEADAILQATIRQVENQNLDQTVLQAFSLTLEQTRGAIAERRASLMAAPAQPS